MDVPIRKHLYIYIYIYIIIIIHIIARAPMHAEQQQAAPRTFVWGLVAMSSADAPYGAVLALKRHLTA